MKSRVLNLFVVLLLAASAQAAQFDEAITPSAAQASPVGSSTAAAAPTQAVPALAPLTGGDQAALKLGGYAPDDSYRLRPGDKLGFEILEDRLVPKIAFDEKQVMPPGLVVADSGEVDVPYIGRVMAKDKTCKQLAEEIKAELEKDYYHRATVVLALDLANKYLGRVYVWGQVRNQGPIDVALNENMTAGKAILRAGGFGDFANKKKVKVIRSSGEGGAKETFEINMVEILEQGKTEKDVVLRPDDFVLVPSRLINF